MEENSKRLLETLDIFSKILDYEELDLSNFINKKRKEGYYKLLYIKSFFYLLFYFTLFSQTFILNLFMDEIRIWISYIILSLGYLFFYLGNKIDNKSFRRFVYTNTYYHKEKRMLHEYHQQLHLILNNSVLKDQIIDEDYSKKLENIDKKIEYFATAIKPLYENFKNFGLITLFLSIFLSFSTNLVVQYFSDQGTLEKILVEFLLMPITLVIILYFTYRLFKKSKNESIRKSKKILGFYKEGISINLRLIATSMIRSTFSIQEREIRKVITTEKKDLNTQIKLLKENKEKLKLKLKEIKQKIKKYKKLKNDSDLEIANKEKEKIEEKLNGMDKKIKLLKSDLKRKNNF